MFETIDIPRKIQRWVFGINQAQLQFDYRQCFDALLDFAVQNIFREAASEEWNVDKVQEELSAYFCTMPQNYTPVCFLDNHDMDRFIWQCHGDRDVLASAIQLLSELPAPIAIYYGTESGMVQTESVRTGKLFADLAVRQPMNWDSIDAEMHNWMRACIRQRNA